MASAARSEYLRGLRETKSAFQALPAIAREHLLERAVRPTVSEIVRGAKQRLQASPSIQTRALYNHVVGTVNKKSGRGRVGVSAGSTVIRNPNLGGVGRNTIKIKGLIVEDLHRRTRIDKPSKRAHFIEFGTRDMPAEPFMIPATEAQQQPFLSRCKGTGRLIEQDTAKIGGGASPGGRLL